MIKTIPKKKKCSKAKWLPEEALQIAEKRRDMKGKGENEWYTYLNAEFQKIGRRYKKAFLSKQYKEIEEDNRMKKTRDLFKKIRDTKGTFHAKMSTIKEKNGMDLTEAEDIKRWQEYTESESESEVAQSCPALCNPWTVAHQAPPSMGFSRQEYWSELPFPSPEDLPDPGIEPRSPTLQADALTSEPPGKNTEELYKKKKNFYNQTTTMVWSLI